MGWTRYVGRSIVGVATGGLVAAAVVVLPPGTAFGAPCDGLSCDLHLKEGAAEVPHARPLGNTHSGWTQAATTMICLADFLHADVDSTWSAAPPLVGMRDYGALCSDEHGSAQSPLGIPLRCYDGIWQQYLIDIPAG